MTIEGLPEKWRPKVTKDRFDVIGKYIPGKSVLDMGCMEYGRGQSGKASWLHRRISSMAGEMVGVDLLGDRTGSKEFRIIKANVEDDKFNLGRKFDVIIAGELIEHVQDQRTFLHNIFRHLKSDGHLIITTPNASGMGFFLRKLLKMYRGISAARDHVLLHDEQTVSGVLRLNGFSVVDIVYWQIETYGKKRFFSPFLHLWPDMASNLIVVACPKRGKSK
jgi:2-polyprenyl-3-methyl-5-hydroxy-6-metoxy-1,4-benzoquinol methylase